MGGMLAFLGRDMAVDLGTANTLVYVRRRGIALNEPSVVALNTDTGKIVAVGVQAKQMIGRTPGSIVAVRPLKDGVIADFDVTERMLRYVILQGAPAPAPGQAAAGGGGAQRDHRRGAKRGEGSPAPGRGPPRVHHRGADGGRDRRRTAGAREAGNMVVDVGGGTTEVAVISLGGIVASGSIRVGGDEMDRAIIAFAKRSTHSCWANGPPSRPGWRSDRPARPQRSRTSRSAAAIWSAACRRPSSSLPGRSGTRSPTRRRSRGHRQDHARQVPARARRRRHGPRHRPDGGGALLRGLDERLGEETGYRFTWRAIRWNRSCSARASAWRTSTPSSRC